MNDGKNTILKVLLFANTDWFLYNYRLSLIHKLHERGDELTLVAPPGNYLTRLQSLGFRCIEFPFSRSGINPLKEYPTLLKLKKIYRREKPDLFIHFTIKCVLYGSLVAQWNRKGIILNSIDGLGYVFSSEDFKARFLRWLLKPAYRFIMQRSYTIFQNPDDRDLFLQMRLANGKRTALIKGVGIDVADIESIGNETEIPVVLYAGRFLYSKGIAEFVEAARIIKKDGIAARFVLVGEGDRGNPESIDQATLLTWEQEGAVEVWGWKENMQEVYPRVSIFCLPSYREGIPRVLLEAAANRIPLVASDVPGCREVVRNGENGLLVPPRDPAALADAVRRLLQDASLRKEMGERGRQIVKEQFSSSKVVEEMLLVIDRLTQEGSVELSTH